MTRIRRTFNVTVLTYSILVLNLLPSCNFDQAEALYPDFYSANKDMLFEKGWIPVSLTYKSMTDIYLSSNLDLNSCIFSFKLSNKDIKTLKQKLQVLKTKFAEPRRVNIPPEWTLAVNKLDHYIYTKSVKSDSLYLAIDEQDGKVYGWRK